MDPGSRSLPDALTRRGPLACHVLSTGEMLERVLRGWRTSVRWRAEDVPGVDAAFLRLGTDLFSAASDILADPRYVTPHGTEHDRSYRYASDPDSMPATLATALALALQAASHWGEKVVDILRAEAATSSVATLYLNQPEKVNVQSAALGEIRLVQVAAVGPVGGLPDPARLADTCDYICFGLHAATVRPERLRTFLAAVVGEVTRRFTSRNKGAVLSAAQWATEYGPRSGRPAAPAGAGRAWTRSRRRWRAAQRNEPSGGYREGARPSGPAPRPPPGTGGAGGAAERRPQPPAWGGPRPATGPRWPGPPR